jgi:hypothetical protein
MKHPEPQKQIGHPRVLSVTFKKQKGKWMLRIPHAYGENDHFTAPVSNNLVLQFQPTRMNNLLSGDSVVGVACLPLVFMTDEDKLKTKADGDGEKQ